MAEDLLGLGKALEAIGGLTKEPRQLLYDLLGPVARESGELLADKVRMRRFRNAEQMISDAGSRLREVGIEPKPVSLKVLIPILEDGSLEEDYDLVSKWAGLLASASAGNRVLTCYPWLLSQLNAAEANVLSTVYDWHDLSPI
jgi:hypothetical protein